MNIPKHWTALILTVPLTATAITDIESQHKNADKQGLSGVLEFSVSGKTGNSKKQTNSLAGQLNYRSGPHQHLTILSSEYGESSDVKDTDNNFAHQRYIYHYSNRLAFEGYVQYQDDEFRLLELRALVGGGVKFKLSPEDEQYQLNIGVGAYHTKEVYNINDTVDLREDYLRASSYMSFSTQLTATTTFSDTLYWQPRFSQPSDSYVYNTLSISVKISEWLALKVELETHYDSDPVNDVENTDHSYLTSLQYTF